MVTILPSRESKHGSELRVSAMRNTNRNGNIPVIQEHISGKGKSHIDVWLCDTCEALRRANDSAFMRWLEERIRTVLA